MGEVSSKSIRKDLIKYSISNTAIARELEISVREASAFRKGSDQAISAFKQAKLVVFIRDHKRNLESYN